MKRKLLIILFILFVLSVCIGTSPIVDYFYSLGAEAEFTTVPLGTTEITQTAERSTEHFSTALVGASTDAPSTSESAANNGANEEVTDKIKPETVYFAIGLSSLTVAVCFIVYLKKRKV